MDNKYVEFSKDNPFSSQAKMLLHIDRLYEYLTKNDTHPIFMELNITDFCNLSCKWCISGNRVGTASLKIRNLKKFLKEFYEMGGKAVNISGGGEPTTYEYFIEAVEFAKDVGLDLGLMTNGVFPSRLIKCIGYNFNWVRISLDTVNIETYKSLKGIDGIGIVLRNINDLSQYPVKVGVNCNIIKEYSIKDIDDLISAVLPMANYLQFRPILPCFFRSEKPELNQPVWDYLIENHSNNEKINLSNDKLKDILYQRDFPFKYCEGHFFSPILNANGDIAICMYHPGDQRFVFGNIYESSFKEIWESETRKKVIEFVRTLDYKENCQMCCKLTEINKLIDFIKYSKVEDANFL
jgi:radical SAM protein with 4Fe4S-binding SPASM domain